MMNEHRRGEVLVRLGTTALLALPLTACGAAGSLASAAVKSQIESQCGGVGLKGCPEIAEGAIAYASGKDAEGEAQLRTAAAKNSPEQVRQFMKALKPILEAADPDTAKKLRGVIAILEGNPSVPDEDDVASPAAKTAHAAGRAKKPDMAAITTATTTGASSGAGGARSEIDSLRAGMVHLPTETQMLPCDPSMNDTRTCGRVRVLLGPFVLTNLYTSGGCSEELFVTSSDSKAQWTMLTVAGDRLNVTGRFPVEEGQSLYVGIRGTVPAKNDLRCAVVWSGFRPAEKLAPKSYGTLGDGD